MNENKEKTLLDVINAVGPRQTLDNPLRVWVESAKQDDKRMIVNEITFNKGGNNELEHPEIILKAEPEIKKGYVTVRDLIAKLSEAQDLDAPVTVLGTHLDRSEVTSVGPSPHNNHFDIVIAHSS